MSLTCSTIPKTCTWRSVPSEWENEVAVLEEGAESDVVAGGAEYILEFHEEIDDVLLVKVGDAGPDRFGNHFPDCFDFIYQILNF